MANKKLGKLLALTALVGAGVAAGIAYFKHKNNSEFFDDDFDDLDDDFDDEDFDFPLTTEDGNSTIKREYVSLNFEKDSTDSKDSDGTESKQEDANPVSEDTTTTNEEATDKTSDSL